MRTFSSLPLLVFSLAAPLAAQTVGAAAPDIEWQTALQFNGAPAQKLSELRGSVVLLEFWATWCGPCKAQIPHLNELHTEKADRGLVVVGVSSEAEGVVTAFTKTTEMRYPIALAKPAAYNVTGIPHAFLIGTDGTLLWAGHPAQLDAKRVDEALVGAHSAFVGKGLEDVHALLRSGDQGAAYNKGKDLLAAGTLPEQSQAQAKSLLLAIEKTVTEHLAAADAAAAAKDVFAQWSQLEPIALHHHGVPGADVARKRYDALLADPANKDEIAAAKALLGAQARETALDFDGAWKAYQEVVAANAGTGAAKRAERRMRAIEIEGKLGFDNTCAECVAGRTACRRHKKKPQ